MDIIDIGSNSVRLLSGGKKTAIVTRLAQGMNGGVLDKASMERTIDALQELCSLSHSRLAFATEAVRKAINKDEFLDAVYKRTGLKVEILSGEEEAEIGFLGATAEIDGKATVIDLGGASCEISCGENGKIFYMRSFPFGCVTMTDSFGVDLDRISEHVTKALDCLPKLYSKVIAVGGTATSLAAMAQKLAVYDQSKVHLFELGSDVISDLITRVIEGEDFPSLDPKRRATIAQGATVLSAVMKKLGASKLTVSESDNMEGFLIKKGLPIQ